MNLSISVVGHPVQQGSKDAFYNAKLGRAMVVDANKKTLRPWRREVRETATAAIKADPHWTGPMLGAVEVSIIFYIKRPGYHFRTGRDAHQLKPNAPTYVDKRPDLDKLVRAILDALDDAGAFRDDAQVAVLTTSKEYANAAPGARITVAALAGAV